ncbi:MAG: choice-of-anchor Q domain-containing protein [Pyrinomonadaceae bacterium]
MLNKFGFAMILSVLVMFAGVSARAAVYTVDNNNDFTSAQNCTAAPNDCSLRAALQFANNSPENDTINFDPAFIGGGQEIPLGSFQQFTISNNGTLTINGPGAKLLSLNGVNLVRVLNVSAGATVSISGLTIRNGFGAGGGGIRNAGNLSLNSCEIKFNTGGQFDPNRFGGGGGILNEGNLNLINSTVYGNTATQNSSFRGSAGGGVFNSGGGTANIINSTISGNKATGESYGSGGGIWNDGQVSISPTINLINSTIAFNIGEGTGSLPDCRGGGVNNNGGIVNARNTIVAGNGFNCGSRGIAPDYYNKLNSQGYNLIGIQTCGTTGGGMPFCFTDIMGDTTGNIVNVNAQLGSLADNGGQTLTHALLSGSPAINAGSNAKATDQNNNPLTTDGRGAGFPRINNSTVDMGAYETLLLPANTMTTITADTPDPSNEGQSVTVSYTVTSGAGTPTGNVTVTDGVDSCTGTVAAGQCSLTLNTSGSRTLTASYGGDMNFNPSTSAGEPHTVNPAAPLVLVVDNTTDNGALSACTAAANDCSLRGAISRANAVSTNDTINFSASVFNVARTIIVSNGELAVTNNGGLIINGTGANLLNISGGGGSSRVFRFNTVSPVVINSLTISGGNSMDGGGILDDSTYLTINNCNISGNGASGFGGGIYNVNGRVDINSSTISGNTAGGSGGGIANGGNPSVLNISNSTISGNTSNGLGGGGIFTNAQVNVYNSTITNNTANGDGTSTGIGGGISNFTFEAVSLGNTIVAGNNAPTAPDFRDTLTSLGHNLIGNTSGTAITGNTDGNLLNVNPLLGSLASNGGPTQTHLLSPNSPAVNAGNNFLAVDAAFTQYLTTDQRGTGFNRISSGIVDIGAFENNLPVVTENPQSQTVGAGASVTFTARGGVFSQTAPSSLSGGQPLLPGQFLISPNFGYQLIYQTDGNLVLYRGDGVVLWNTGTFGTSPGRAEMQTDGNFVIYDSNNNVQFSAGTFGNPGASIVLQDDGNLVIYNMGNPIYSTGTNFSGPNPIPTVQWQVSTDGGANFTNLSDGLVNVSGSTTPRLNFIAEMTDDGNQYRAVFTNTFGGVASAPATLTVLAPTAADVTVSGRVFSPIGGGVPNATVRLTEQNGQIRTARTNQFGYYRFENIEVGQTLIVNVFSKSYQFTPQVITLNDSIKDLNFTANTPF